MTKQEATDTFLADVLPHTLRRYGVDDAPAIAEAWNNWTDDLCKDGQITQHQYRTWTHPRLSRAQLNVALASAPHTIDCDMGCDCSCGRDWLD